MKRWSLYSVSLATLLGLVILLAGCGGGSSTPSTDELPISAGAQVNIDITMDLPAGSPLNARNLRLETVYGDATVTDGVTSLTVGGNGHGGAVLVEDDLGNPLLFTYLPCDMRSKRGALTVLGAEQVAYGLIALNPYLLVFSSEDRDRILIQCASHPSFPALTSQIESVLATDPANLYNPEVFPGLPQLAASIVHEVMAGVSQTSRSIGLDEEPHLEDLSDTPVQLVNPRLVGYEIEIINGNDATVKERLLVEGKDGLYKWVWGIPPMIREEAVTLDYDLGDGNYEINFYKFGGTSLCAFYNVTKTVLCVIDLVGWLPTPNTKSLKDAIINNANMTSLIDDLSSAASDISALGDDGWQFKDYWDTLNIFGDLFKDLDVLQAIIRLLWKGVSEEKFQALVKEFMPFLSVYSKCYDLANEKIPFAYDLVTAPNKSYRINQTNGLLSDGWPSDPGANSLDGPDKLTAYCESTHTIALAWIDRSDIEDGFRIERGTTLGGPYPVVREIGPSPGKGGNVYFNDTELAPGTTYYYRVSAYHGTEHSAYALVYYTTYDLPSAPSGLRAVATGTNAVKLTWTDNSRIEAGFRIERKTGAGGDYERIAELNYPNAETLVNTTNVTGDTTYYYRVYAYNETGHSGYSNEATVTTLNAPTNLQITVESSIKVLLTWTDNSAYEKGYKIERKESGGDWVQIDTVDGQTDYGDSKVLPGRTYYYRIRAYSNNGSEDNHSNYTTSAPVTITSGDIGVIID